MAETKQTLWDVLDKYADVREEFENILYSFGILRDEMEQAMTDIGKDMEHVRRHLDECDRVFRRYKIPKEELPF